MNSEYTLHTHNQALPKDNTMYPQPVKIKSNNNIVN